jgi:hypothetical protein
MARTRSATTTEQRPGAAARRLGLAVCLLVLATAAGAEEGGSGHYVPGATASFIDVMPGEPGVVYLNAFLYYSGSASLRRDIPIAGDLVAGLEGTSYADSSIFLAEVKVNSLPINYAVALVIPYVWMDVSGEVVGGSFTRTRSDSADGLGDIMFSPLMVGWTHEALRLQGYLNVYAPTGAYDVGRLANPGKNFWTFEPGVAASWISPTIGLELTGFLGYGMNTRNPATDYQSGDVLHFDGTIAEHLPLGDLGIFGLGANVFVYQQVTGDSGAGATLGGFEGRTVGIGPTLSYIKDFSGLDLVGEAKWLPELEVDNRLKGDFVWFKIGAVF